MEKGLQIFKWIAIAFVLYVVGSVVMSIIEPMGLADKVKAGMSREEAIKAIGQSPMQELTEFAPCQGKEKHWTGNCANLLASGSKTFLVWKFGVDTALVVGLDASAKVVFSGIGDT